MKKGIIFVLVQCFIVMSIFPALDVKADNSERYDKGIIYHASRHKIEYLDEDNFIDISKYQAQVDANIDNLENYLISLCSTKKMYEYSDGSTLIEYECETISEYYPMLENIIEITKTDYSFGVRYTTIDNKEVTIEYKDNDVIEMIIYDPKEDTAYHYCDCEYMIEYHFTDMSYISMSEELSEYVSTLMEEKKYDEIEKIKGLILYYYDDGEVAVDFDMELITGEDNASLYYASSSSTPTSDSGLLTNLRSSFPEYTNNVKTIKQLTCSAINSSVAVKVTQTRNSYTKKRTSWSRFLAGVTLSTIAASMGFTKNKVKNIIIALNLIITIDEKISSAVSLNGSAIYTFHATKRGCVYDKTVRNGYVLVIRYVDNNKTFTGQYNDSGNFYWTQDYCSVLSTNDNTVANTALTNYTNDLAMNNNLCTYMSEYAQWSD